MKNLMIICQAVDAKHPVLGFFPDWIREFASRCGRVIVVAQAVGTHDLPGNVEVVSLGKERGVPKPLQLLKLWKTLCGRRAAYDSIFVHMSPEYAIAAAPVARLVRKPMSLWYTHKSVSWSLRIAERFVERIFTASDESLRLATSKKRVVGHGIPVERVLPRRPRAESFRLLSVGRLAPAKRHDLFIEALAKLEPSFTLTIAGAPALAEDAACAALLRRRATELDVSDRVRFAGEVRYDDVWKLYASHDLFVHASRTGSVDKVVLEALATGLPVASASEGFGWLPPEMRVADDPGAFSEAARAWRERLARDPNAAAAVSERVRREHALGGMIDRLLKELDTLK